MQIARIDPKARGIVCAVKRANVIGARDQRTTSGPAGRQNPHRQAEDMTAPTIKRNAAKKPLISGRHPDEGAWVITIQNDLKIGYTWPA